jgi:hypothetical protein
MLGFLRGRSGELRAGYQCAAKLGKWSARKDRTTGVWTVEAKAESVHPVWIEYTGGLEASLCFGNGVRWRWRKAEILNRDGTFLFQVSGEPEKNGR